MQLYIFGMEKYLKDWNYKIFPKKFKIPCENNLNLDYIEKNISNFGLIVLKWAIVNVENNSLIIEAVVIEKEEIKK